MTTAQQRTTPRWVLVFLAALIAALAAILGTATASAQVGSIAESRVGAFGVTVDPLVGPPEHDSAGQGRAAVLERRQIAAATGVAVKTGPSIGAKVKALSGREYKFGPNFRIAPFGNRTGHPTGRYPHYHRRVVDDAGETLPGLGIGRHRPWDKKSTDTSFWDRF